MNIRIHPLGSINIHCRCDRNQANTCLVVDQSFAWMERLSQRSHCSQRKSWIQSKSIEQMCVEGELSSIQEFTCIIYWSEMMCWNLFKDVMEEMCVESFYCEGDTGSVCIKSTSALWGGMDFIPAAGQSRGFESSSKCWSLFFFGSFSAFSLNVCF